MLIIDDYSRSSATCPYFGQEARLTLWCFAAHHWVFWTCGTWGRVKCAKVLFTEYIWIRDTRIFWSRCPRPWCQLCRCSSSLQAGSKGYDMLWSWLNIMALIFQSPFCYCHQNADSWGSIHFLSQMPVLIYRYCNQRWQGSSKQGCSWNPLCQIGAYVSHGWIGWLNLLWLHVAVLLLLKWQVFSQGKMKQLVATNSTSVFWTYSFNNVTWCDLDLDTQLRNRMPTHWYAKNWVWDDVKCCS